MFGKGKGVVCAFVLGGILLATPAFLKAFQLTRPGQSPTPTQQAPEQAEEETSQVVIQREALSLIDPEAYQTPLYLEPIRSLELSAPVDGTIRNLHFDSGQTAGAQAEVVRLDGTEQQLLVQRAKANYRVAQLELNQAKKSQEPDQIEIAEAKLEAAKAELDVEELRQQRTIIRAPFEGRVFRIHVIEGEYIRAGQPLLTWGDASQLKVEIPLERANATPGNTVDF